MEGNGDLEGHGDYAPPRRAPEAWDRVSIVFGSSARAPGKPGLTFRWISPDGAWECSGLFDVREDRKGIAIESLQLKPGPTGPAGGGLTSTTLRMVPVGRIMAQARADLVSMTIPPSFAQALMPGTASPSFLGEFMARMASSMERAITAARQTGRLGKGDPFYRDIALSYLKLQDEGIGRGILLRLAQDLGRPRETIRDWVHEARVRGFLTPGTQGKAGALPGPRLLAQDEQEADDG